MPTRRAKSEIIEDILVEAFEKSAKTRILNRANMNVKAFEKYIKVLEEKKYMETVRGPKGPTLFRTTEKGRELLRKIAEIRQIIEATRSSTE